jgi:hypothetical protein
MPIKVLEQQRRAHEVGRIRLGVKVANDQKPGSMRPVKLSCLRFTSRDQKAIRTIAELYGGEPKGWDNAPVDEQWEVFTTAREIGVLVPPGPQSVSQWMEYWDKADPRDKRSPVGCLRRCDGDRETLTDSPCLCKAEGREVCRPTTRVSVMLPDVRGMGVWRVDSHGWNAAHELGGTAALLAAVRERGAWVPATLRLEKRRSVVRGKVFEYAVPVLSPETTVREMLEAPQTDRIELPAPPPRALAIEAAKPQQAASGATPTPDSAQASRDLPPTSSQEMAARVETCEDLAYLRSKLARFAIGQRWMEDFVDSRYAPEEGELIELREVFRGRENEIEGACRG